MGLVRRNRGAGRDRGPGPRGVRLADGRPRARPHHRSGPGREPPRHRDDPHARSSAPVCPAAAHRRVLDLGAHGVMIPRMDTPPGRQGGRVHALPAERHRRARALDPWRGPRRADAPRRPVDHPQILGIIQIESPSAVEHAAEIAAIDGVDACSSDRPICRTVLGSRVASTTRSISMPSPTSRRSPRLRARRPGSCCTTPRSSPGIANSASDSSGSGRIGFRGQRRPGHPRAADPSR